MPPSIRIEDLPREDDDAHRACAQVLVDAFRGHTDHWAEFDRALETVRDALDGAAARIARDPDGGIVGWIGALEQYDGHAWEVHPVAVAPDAQRRGIGRALLADIERLAAERGVTTLWLGTDDEDGRTSLAGVDPYPDVLGSLARIENRGEHPFEFYQKCGFVIVGMLPDANGPGRPDIFMAKRVQPRT